MLVINHHAYASAPESEGLAYPEARTWPDICAIVREYCEAMALSVTVTQSRELARDYLRHGAASAYVPDCATGHPARITLSNEESI